MLFGKETSSVSFIYKIKVVTIYFEFEHHDKRYGLDPIKMEYFEFIAKFHNAAADIQFIRTS